MGVKGFYLGAEYLQLDIKVIDVSIGFGVKGQPLDVKVLQLGIMLVYFSIAFIIECKQRF